MDQKKQKVLIIDDLPDNLEVIGDLVSDECEVFCSLSGCEGLELARTVQPDLILLDIMMPQMDGYEVCRVLKQDPLTSDIPVIMVTALNQAEDETRGIELGAIDYVTKPLNVPIVRARIHNHLARRRMELLLQERTDLLDQKRTKLEKLTRELEARVALEVNLNRLKDQEIIANDKLAAIGQLAAGVAHEINNPLGFVSGNCLIMQRNLDALDLFDSRQQEFIRLLPQEERERSAAVRKALDIDFILEDSSEMLRESLSGINRIVDTIRDLKRFSRVDCMEKELYSLSKCMENVLNVCRDDLSHVVAIRQEYKPAPQLVCLVGDFHQMFHNLFINAAQAITTQGEIILRCWSDEEYIFASISDNGCGIPDECREKIFEPFFTTRAIGQGAGLGLSVVYQIVQAHGGTIQFTSEVGSGTTFTLAFPINGSNNA